jgi:hypothetical protein
VPTSCSRCAARARDLAGAGGGFSWLQEHLGDDYIAAWFVPVLQDAAIINSGMSRWHNYYVEGMHWLVQQIGIDGIYLDDVAFDRTTMKRVKRVLTQDGHPGIVDLHSANQFNQRDGYISSALLYLEHFPYVNRLWFGEYFDYERSSADFYLTEVSGIPFGLMGEMLEGGGNPWRGMVYGMTNRMPWTENSDPRPLWTAWDAFGMADTRMIGYWVMRTPVKTSRADVLATTFVKPAAATPSGARALVASRAGPRPTCRSSCHSTGRRSGSIPRVPWSRHSRLTASSRPACSRPATRFPWRAAEAGS